MPALSFAPYIAKRPWLSKLFSPLSNWYRNAAGYRKIGLKHDDLIPEESETVLLALKRLDAKESYNRVYRLRRAFQCSVSHTILPKEQHTKAEEDVPYLSPIIAEIEAEQQEKADLDSLVVSKRKA